MFKFNPISLTPVMWFDTDYGLESSAGVPATNGGVVGRWLDKGGSGYHATNSTAGAQPIFVGPHSGISGDGSNDQLVVGGSNQPIFEFFSVQKSTTTNFNNYWFPIANQNGASTNRLGCFTNGATNLWADPVQTNVRRNGTRLDTVSVTNADLAPITGDFLLNVVPTIPNSASRVYTLLAMENTYFGNANVKEVMAFNRVLSANERNLLNNYFSTKYNIPVVSSPEDITGLYLWLNADSCTGVHNSPVANWRDHGPNGFHFAQGTTASQPILKKNSMNGHAALNFNGTNQYLTRAHLTPGTTTTTFVVARPRVTSAQSDQYGTLYIDANTRLVMRTALNSWGTFSATHGDINAGESLERYRPSLLRVQTAPGSGTQVYRDGVLKVSSAGNTAGDNATSIGENIGYTRFYKGDIAEIIQYNRALTTQEIERIEKYLTEKYNIGFSLPTSVSGCRMWVDAENLGLANGAVVSSWTDRTSFASSITQANATYQPTYATAGIGDKPAINFNGSKYFDTNVTGPGSSFTFFWAAQGTNYQSIVRWQKNNGYIVFPWNTSSALDINNGNTSDMLTFTFGTTSPQIAVYYSEPSQTLGRAIRLNGNHIAAKSTGAGAINDFLNLGAYIQSTPSEFTNAMVGDVIIFSRRLQLDEIRFVEEYLRCKYNQ